ANPVCARKACAATRVAQSFYEAPFWPRSSALGHLRAFRVAMAFHQMIVDHADGLHKGIDDGRSAKFESAPREFLRHVARGFRFRRNLCHAAKTVHLRLAAGDIPKERGKSRSFLHDIEPGARRKHRSFDFRAVAYDACVLHQRLDLPRREAGNLLRRKASEGAAEILPLPQNSDPRQAGLKAVEHELFIKRAVVGFRRAQFLIVIADIQLVVARPRPARQTVGMGGGSHPAAFDAPGQAPRAHCGFKACNSRPPAVSGRSAANASSNRSRRNMARPRPSALEPSVPTCLSPAMTGVPASAAKPS